MDIYIYNRTKTGGSSFPTRFSGGLFQENFSTFKLCSIYIYVSIYMICENR